MERGRDWDSNEVRELAAWVQVVGGGMGSVWGAMCGRVAVGGPQLWGDSLWGVRNPAGRGQADGGREWGGGYGDGRLMGSAGGDRTVPRGGMVGWKGMQGDGRGQCGGRDGGNVSAVGR
jgi:hypothetical protein